MHRQGRLADTGGPGDRGDHHRATDVAVVAGHQGVQPIQFGSTSDEIRHPVRQLGRCGRPVLGFGFQAAGRDTVGGHRRRQARVHGQDPLVELLQLGRRLDAEFVDEVLVGVPEGGQGLPLAPGSVQRQHEQATQPLPQRVVGDELTQLADQVLVVTDGQVDLDTFRHHVDPPFGEAVPLGVQERARQSVERRPSPQPQRGMQRLGRDPQVPRGARATGATDLAAEDLEIQTAGRHGQQIPRVGPGQQLGRGPGRSNRFEHPAQSGDVLLHQVHRVGRRRRAPDRVDELLAAQWPVCVYGEHR